MTQASFEAVDDAVRRVERWLLTSSIQVSEGPQRGGIAGWLDANGNPEFVYLEITGYYLTAMAWLIAGGAREGESGELARKRGQHAVDWVATSVCGGQLPPTRLLLSESPPQDWRNEAVFTFDLAMAIRGLAAFNNVVRVAAASVAIEALTDRLREITGDARALRSHRANGAEKPPARWSTLPGPHHLKAAAALLELPCDGMLAAAAQTTWERWILELEIGLPVAELHPLIYGLEGMAMAVDRPLEVAERPFRRIMEWQQPDGTLPAEASGSALVRADVLAQALRMGVLLRRAGLLEGEDWEDRLDRLAVRLLDHVRPNGSVAFSLDQDIDNAWCAMFAQQALVLYGRRDRASAALGRRYLI